MDANPQLEAAVRAKNLKKVKEALARGADPNLLMSTNGDSALSWAAGSGRAELVEALLEAGARLRQGHAASTALHTAAARGDVAVIEMLLKAEGRKALNAADDEGRTPLMCAVEAGQIPAVRALIAAGADVNAHHPAGCGNTALRCAAAEGTLEMVKTLLAAGADPQLPGRMKLSALDRAHERRTPEGRMILAMLTKAGQQAENDPPKARARRVLKASRGNSRKGGRPSRGRN